MSKIGKKNIIVPKEASVKIEGSNLIFTGPKGSTKLTVNDKIFSSKINEKNEFQILPLNKEIDKKIHFIRKLIAGGSEHSFGIHVAKVAGMPQKIISKAEKILKSLELDKTQNTKKEISTLEKEDHQQLSFFQLDDPILSDIRNEIDNLDVNSLTPVEALVLLNDIKKKLGS